MRFKVFNFLKLSKSYRKLRVLKTEAGEKLELLRETQKLIRDGHVGSKKEKKKNK